MAATRPPIRLAASEPHPCESSHPRLAGVVMLFHSSMERMKSTLPDADDGEIEPKTASWRANHGASTTRKSAKQATAAHRGIAGRREPPPRHAGPAIPREGKRERRAHEDPVVAGQGRQAHEEAAERERARVATQPARAHPERTGHQRLVEAEVVGLGHEDGGGQGDGHQDAGPHGNEAGGSRVAREGPRERRRQRAQEGERQRGGDRGGAEEPDERDLDDARPAASSGRSTGPAGSGRPGSRRPPRGRSRSRRS